MIIGLRGLENLIRGCVEYLRPPIFEFIIFESDLNENQVLEKLASPH
jgi:hypothetical protein